MDVYDKVLFARLRKENKQIFAVSDLKSTDEIVKRYKDIYDLEFHYRELSQLYLEEIKSFGVKIVKCQD